MSNIVRLVVLLTNPRPPEPDFYMEEKLQEFEVACAQFRQVCDMIKEFAGLDEFTGGFDEAIWVRSAWVVV